MQNPIYDVSCLRFIYEEKLIYKSIWFTVVYFNIILLRLAFVASGSRLLNYLYHLYHTTILCGNRILDKKLFSLNFSSKTKDGTNN